MGLTLKCTAVILSGRAVLNVNKQDRERDSLIIFKKKNSLLLLFMTTFLA